MPNEFKQYLLAPNWDYVPNRPIALGNIIVLSLPRQAADVVTLLCQRRDGSLHDNDRYMLPLTSHELRLADLGRDLPTAVPVLVPVRELLRIMLDDVE